MRHQKSGKRFSRPSSHRNALWSNMVSSLIEAERIKTTLPKAKELRRFAEPVLARAIGVASIAIKTEAERSLEEKEQLLHAIRIVSRTVKNKTTLKKLFSELANRLKDRKGGYLRITKAGYRVGDAAPMSIVELID